MKMGHIFANNQWLTVSLYDYSTSLNIDNFLHQEFKYSIQFKHAKKNKEFSNQEVINNPTSNADRKLPTHHVLVIDTTYHTC